MGAIAVATPKRGDIASFSGPLRAILARYHFSSSYPAGGEEVDLVDYYPGVWNDGGVWDDGLPWNDRFVYLVAQKIRMVFAEAKAGYLFFWDAGTRKLKAYQSAAGAGQLVEVAGGTDLKAAVDFVPLLALAVGHKEDEV